jgi:hypothetical protein
VALWFRVLLLDLPVGASTSFPNQLYHHKTHVVPVPHCRHPAEGVQAAALGAKPGVIATLITDHLLGGASGGSDDKAQFLVAHGIGHLLMPLLSGWLITTAMRNVAQGARRYDTVQWLLLLLLLLSTNHVEA